MAHRLDNKVAIVTGASRGIGQAIAKFYAQEGAKVLGVYHTDYAAAQQTLAEIKAAGGEASFVQGDVSNQADTQKMAEEAMRLYGRIDILCANAATFSGARIADMTEEMWDRSQAVNLKGTFLAVKACLPQMQAQNYGKIVVISSTTGVESGISRQSHYGASKGGQIGFVLCACLELAQYNITINAVAPGWVLTDATKGMGDKVDKIAHEIPMQRFAEPLDIAYGVLFLSTDESRYITGQTLVIDGGLGVPETPWDVMQR